MTDTIQNALDVLRLMQSLYECDLIETAPEWSHSLRQAVTDLEALTQRPAAQTEREAWTNADADAARLAMELECLLLGTQDTAAVSRWWASANEALDLHRARISAAQQATPDQFAAASNMVASVALRSVHLTRDTAGMCVVRVNGRVAIRDNGDIIDHMATLEWFADPQQATPEPVGEPVARVELMQTGGSAGLATRIVEIDDPLRERLRPGDLLYPRPAPGVPEADPLQGAVDWFWQAIPHLKAHDVANRLSIGCNRAARLLAAAQAKGGE